MNLAICYLKIITIMVDEAMSGRFQFQNNYIILLLGLSILYAAAMHPTESHQVVHGVVYMLIFPAMHILLPIYRSGSTIDLSFFVSVKMTNFKDFKHLSNEVRYTK